MTSSETWLEGRGLNYNSKNVYKKKTVISTIYIPNNKFV